MKNTQNGFIRIVIIIFIALVAIGGGAYLYVSHNSQVDIASPTEQDFKTTDWKVYSRDSMYEFSYPSYGKIEETNSVITDTTVILTDDWMNTFDVTTHPEELFCKSNPYSNLKNAVDEDKVTKYGNEYRHLHKDDSSNPIDTLTEDRYYKFKNNVCYMIVLRTTEKSGPQITADVEKIFSTFKFTN